MTKPHKTQHLSPSPETGQGAIAVKPKMSALIDATDRLGWWVCACVKGGNWRKGQPSTHIKMHPPTTKRCRACGVTKVQSDAIGRMPR